MNTDQAIKNRKTEKVLASNPWPVHANPLEFKKTIKDLLDLAKFAPYHKKCNELYTSGDRELNSTVPWRVYVLESIDCRKLYEYIDKNEIKAGKISNMLAAADALFMVTWLPEPHNGLHDSINDQEPFPYEGNTRNMEHIAAAATAIQNILIGASSRNIPNYWSSGGYLRKAELRNFLNIPMDEILLGAIFLFPQDYVSKGAEVRMGSMRNQGKELSTWSRSVLLD